MSDIIDIANREADRDRERALFNAVMRRIAGPPIFEKVIKGETVRFCADCETIIPPERITVSPLASLCVGCLAVLERKAEAL